MKVERVTIRLKSELDRGVSFMEVDDALRGGVGVGRPEGDKGFLVDWNDWLPQGLASSGWSFSALETKVFTVLSKEPDSLEELALVTAVIGWFRDNAVFQARETELTSEEVIELILKRLREVRDNK
ncbi:MAG: hypothetical protein KGL39_08555 [Patescibacteria group bacterium]|nr:hypothetical protein [Patescibacteria group bacterium]